MSRVYPASRLQQTIQHCHPLQVSNQTHRSGYLISRPTGHNTAPPLSPQGCVLSPFLYSVFTHDCRSEHGSNAIIKLSDDTLASLRTTMSRPIRKRWIAWLVVKTSIASASLPAIEDIYRKCCFRRATTITKNGCPPCPPVL